VELGNKDLAVRPIGVAVATNCQTYDGELARLVADTASIGTGQSGERIEAALGGCCEGKAPAGRTLDQWKIHGLLPGIARLALLIDLPSARLVIA
jgi:hypothetical protein